MRTPPLLLATTLAFWGWHTDLLLLGVLAGLLLEGARLTRWRWELTQADLGRIWQLCTVLFVGVAAYLVLTTDASGATQAVQTLFQWYPLTVLPIVAAQLYSTDGRVELSILSALVRRKTAKEGRIRERTIDLSYPNFAVCALSASAAHVRTTWFYAGLCLLAAWVLWVNRSRAYSPVLWGSLLASVCLVGYNGHMGLHQLHGLFERNVMDWLSGMSGDRVDPQQSHTALGSVGRMKQSDRIVLRVEPDAGPQTSVLLREATYDLYANAMWFARSSPFQTLAPEADGTTWKLRPGAGSRHGATSSARPCSRSCRERTTTWVACSTGRERRRRRSPLMRRRSSWTPATGKRCTTSVRSRSRVAHGERDLRPEHVLDFVVHGGGWRFRERVASRGRSSRGCDRVVGRGHELGTCEIRADRRLVDRHQR